MKKINLKKIIKIVSFGTSLVVILPFITTSCSNSTSPQGPFPFEVKYLTDGSNWNGHTGGTISSTFSDNDTLEIIGSNSFAGGLNIPEYAKNPETNKTYRITQIGNNSFDNNTNITSLLLPNTINTIGSNAFNACSNLIGSLTIPNSVISIGSNAFRDCSGFSGILTLSNKLEVISNSAFLGCSNIVGSLIIPRNVGQINDNVFKNCSKFSILDLSSWTHIPTWNGNNIFDGWSNSGIVRVNNEQIKDNFKSFLESKGLSTTWTYQV